MKMVKRDDGTIILYPFLDEDSEPWVHSEKITIWPNGNIEIYQLSTQVGMSAGNARLLAEALLHASEIAKTGRKEK